MARHALITSSLVLLMAVTPALAQQKQQKKQAAPAASSATTPGGNDPVVARVNGQIIHRSDIEIALRTAPQQVQQAPLEKVYPQILGSMINATLLAQAGKSAKIDQNPVVKAQLQAAQTELVADAYVASISRSQITEAKLRQSYDQYAKEAPQQEEISARHILVPTEQEAKDIIEQLKKGADFATLAKDKTTDPSGKSNGGDLGYFTKQDMVPEFANVAFALKKGEYTQTPVKTQFGWHVIKLEDRRQGKAGTYEQVAPEIAQRMTQQIVATKLNELRTAGKIEVFDPNGNPIAQAAPAPSQTAPAQAKQPAAAAPTLSLPGQAGGAVPGAPTLSPATAPDKLQR
jgi:peptidyl-prolyl cis-trans isomerase C